MKNRRSVIFVKNGHELYIKDGIARWISNDLVPPRDCLGGLYEKKQISRAEYRKSLKALDRETAKLVAEYRGDFGQFFWSRTERKRPFNEER
jgi:hypothetical protein